MTQKEQLRRRIIELIHGMPYEEAAWKDRGEFMLNFKYIELEAKRECASGYGKKDDADRYSMFLEHVQIMEQNIDNYKRQPITLGRLLYALSLSECIYGFGSKTHIQPSNLAVETAARGKSYDFNWLLTLPSGQEATLDDQSEETIEALHQLLCQYAHN